MPEGQIKEHTNRARAQQAIYDHINRGRVGSGIYSWNEIHVKYVSSAYGKNWEAIVRVTTKDDKLYLVKYIHESDDLVVDTFTRKHVSHYL